MGRAAEGLHTRGREGGRRARSRYGSRTRVAALTSLPVLRRWIIDNHLKEIDKATSSGYSSYMDVFYFMSALIFDVLIRILIVDAMNVIMSILLVFFYIWYMVGSAFLAVIGMVEILLSLPTA
eukprot:731300-Hanusia_phi.AAC.1